MAATQERGAGAATRAPDIVEAYRRLEEWGRARQWLGRDPYEGLNTPFADRLTLGGRPLARRLLIQSVKTSPVDLRPLLRIPREYNAKALALVASGYARGGGDPGPWLEGLVEMDLAEADDAAAWGYHFPFQSRVFFYPAHSPNTIATSFAVHALVDGYERSGEERWLERALAAARWLVRRMLVRRGSGPPHFAYVPAHDDLIHNANALAAAVVLRARAAAGEPAAPEALEALTGLVAAQRPDGSWPYGEDPGLEWIDHYHTGYVLESLEYARRATGEFASPLERGVDFYERRLFMDDGVTPRWTVERELPRDTHCIAQAIDTHAALAGWREGSLERALEIARAGIAAAQKRDGSYVFERRRLWTSRLALIRWTNGPMFRALGSLIQALG